MHDKAKESAGFFSRESQVCTCSQPVEPHAVESDHVAGTPRSTLVSLIFMDTRRYHMQILFLAHRIPYPPDKGERIRAFHELRYLAARHDVDLFCFADSQECAENQRFLQGVCRSIYVEVPQKPIRHLQAAVNFFAGRPMSFGFFHSRKFDEKVRQALRRCKYDVIFVYSASMGDSIPRPAPATVVVDFVDADSQKFRQYAAKSSLLRSWLYAREAHAVAIAEQSLGNMAAVSFAVTEHDARELCRSHAEGFKVEVVSNGVQVPHSSEV